MIDVACTPPMHVFASLSTSRANPHKTHFCTTMKTLEKNRDDKNGKGDVALCNEIWKNCMFYAWI